MNNLAETETQVVVVKPDIERVMSLPSRPPLDCEREPGTRRWTPAAQALVEMMTEKYSLGPRLSCGCQPRTVTAAAGGMITVFREGREGAPPSIPLITTIEAFCADNAHNAETVRMVSNLRAGQSVDLPGLGIHFCMTTLNPVQAWILRELPKTQGVFGLVSVGGGKTNAGVLAPLAIPNCKTAIILAKPDQRLHYRNAYLRLREHFRVPSIVFDKSDMQGSYIVPGTPVLHFIPYSQLSNTKSTDLLDRLQADTVIADESHSLSARQSSRTMRFLRYMRQQENVRFCCWSGSMVKKSLKDASHLSAHALGLGSPYPLGDAPTDMWAAVIDPSPVPDTSSPTARELRKAFGVKDRGNSPFYAANEGVRNGFRDRMVKTPGVISTKSSSVTASISISARRAPPIPVNVQDDLAKVRGEWVRPDGEELVEALEQLRCAREVASGFYYHFVYKKGTPKDLIEDWFAKRKVFNKELRLRVAKGDLHMDSKSLCENAAERAWRTPRYDGDLPVWPCETWPAWAAVKDLVEYDSREVWIDDYLARDAAEWAKTHRGIVWCQSRAFGMKVAELAGINYHGGGTEAEAKILAEDGKRSIVASIKAHGTGRDQLQFVFHKQLIAEIPSSADLWQQLLGRLCREGQREDTVETEVYVHTEELKNAMRKAVMLAQFIEATTPNAQLLLAADMDIAL